MALQTAERLTAPYFSSREVVSLGKSHPIFLAVFKIIGNKRFAEALRVQIAIPTR